MDTLITAKETAEEIRESYQWKQLWSLAALYASVVIGWIAYENYQPKLLVQYQFTDFSFLLMVAQGIILVTTPLVAGKIGDRYRAERGHRLPIISAGISLAAMVFMAVAFTLLLQPGQIFRWALPVLIVFWLIAMSIFTSPALSTVELFTPLEKLPHAMAILTITGNLVYCLEPVIVDVIDYLGAPATFVVGGVAVFLSGYALKKNALSLFSASANREPESPPAAPIQSSYGFIFFLGLCLGVATALLLYIFPLTLGETMGPFFDVEGKIIVVAILLFSALLSWPMGYIVNWYGMNLSFWVSAAAVALSVAAVYVFSDFGMMFVAVATFSVAFTLLSVSSLPLAIQRSARFEKVFCVGVFFSAVALPEAFWQAFMAYAT